VSATLTSITIAAPTRIYAEDEDPSLFHRPRTWWVLLAVLLLADQNSIFTVASAQGKSLAVVKQYYDVSTALLLVLTVMLWGIVAGLMMNRLGPTLRLMLRQKAVLSFSIVAFLSVLWSQDPQLTFKKAMWLFLASAFAWFFASYYRPADQMRIFLVAGVILAISSYAMAILLPKYGLDSGGQWKGVLGQKNQLGHVILFLFSAIAFRPIPGNHRLRTVALGAILPLGLIILSQSKGSLALAILLIAVRFYGPIVKNSRREQLPFILFATFCVVLGVVFGREIIFSLLGRDTTLTGRTHEWVILSFYALRHTWLGYGYGAFWTGTGDSLHAMKQVGGAMRGADSGYLDTMLQLGLAGMILWPIVMLVTMKDFVRLFRRNFVSLAAYWYAGIVLVTFVGSFTDDFFPTAGIFATFMFVVACAGLRDWSRDYKFMAASGLTGPGLTEEDAFSDLDRSHRDSAGVGALQQC
jgi:exopolysaccharide production protein ExoQ